MVYAPIHNQVNSSATGDVRRDALSYLMKVGASNKPVIVTVDSLENDDVTREPLWYRVAQDRHSYQKMRTTRRWALNTSKKYRRRDGSVSMRGNRWDWEDRADRARLIELKYAHVD